MKPLLVAPLQLAFVAGSTMHPPPLHASARQATETQRIAPTAFVNLDDDFGLSERAVNIFVGQAIEYEIANVGDTAFTVVAKVRRSNLPR